jgi:hypothetical protein
VENNGLNIQHPRPCCDILAATPSVEVLTRPFLRSVLWRPACRATWEDPLYRFAESLFHPSLNLYAKKSCREGRQTLSENRAENKETNSAQTCFHQRVRRLHGTCQSPACPRLAQNFTSPKQFPDRDETSSRNKPKAQVSGAVAQSGRAGVLEQASLSANAVKPVAMQLRACGVHLVRIAPINLSCMGRAGEASSRRLNFKIFPLNQS